MEERLNVVRLCNRWSSRCVVFGSVTLEGEKQSLIFCKIDMRLRGEKGVLFIKIKYPDSPTHTSFIILFYPETLPNLLHFTFKFHFATKLVCTCFKFLLGCNLLRFLSLSEILVFRTLSIKQRRVHNKLNTKCYTQKGVHLTKTCRRLQEFFELSRRWCMNRTFKQLKHNVEERD